MSEKNDYFNNPNRLRILMYEYLLFKHERVHHSYGVLLDSFFKRLQAKYPEKQFNQDDYLQLLVISSKIQMFDEVYMELISLLQSYVDY